MHHTLSRSKFPALLKAIADPPTHLFYRGNIALLHTPLLSIIGARAHSSYAPRVLQRWIPSIVGAGITTVSGLALGTDSIVHRETIASNGSTIAVLGSGIDIIAPTSHTQLAESIIEHNGLLLSEYPPGTPARKHHFVARNRIIAGIASTTLIIEAAKKSGTRITAEFALEEGRNVCCVPGDVTRPTSEGTNELLKQGAQLITATNEILELYNKSTHANNAIKALPQHLTAIERHVIEQVFSEPQEIDTLLQTPHYSANQLLQTISQLELRGHIIRDSNNRIQSNV